MRILIGVDGSSPSDAVILEAAQRPWPAGSEFKVVTVVDPFFFPKAPMPFEEEKKRAQQSLEGQTKPLVDAGWHMRVRLILGSVSETVALHATCSVEVVRKSLAVL
jgi:nucleotide-binding universal stress UspA family protein